MRPISQNRAKKLRAGSSVVADVLAVPEENFRTTADQVIRRYQELYRRLA